MSGLRHLLLLGFATAGLAACGEADVPPDRQPGLWEQSVNVGAVSRVTNICLNDRVAKTADWWGAQMNRGNCKTNSFKGREDGGWDFESTCDMGTNGVVETKGVVYGDFVHRFMVRGTQTTTGALLKTANGVRKVSIDAKFQFECPQPYQPGDIWIEGYKPKPDESTVKQVGPVPFNDNAATIPQVVSLREAAQKAQ
ncbi:DUF3617 family protein [Phenylobacterium sp.]|uniref:DUF3617 domain-containing protein n=1 Tax=Phenylobacterium sp. TaxID=1871053 RepID=UPI00286AC4E9|nr:DUF3617 family protein [Phenylobacterium sp.]